MKKSSRRLALTLILGSVSLITALVVLAFMVLPGPPLSVPINKISIPQHELTGIYLNTHSAIYRENQQPGTGDWELDKHAHLNYIQGYAGRVSAAPGEQVPLYISMLTPQTYELDVYRIGWYHGKGGRLFASIKNLQGRAQGLWDHTDGLFNCPTCTRNPITNEIEAHWAVSYTLTIGSDWPSGVYLIKMITAHQDEGYIILVVRAPHANTDALVNLPVNTYQAYNLWGGYSLYMRGQDNSYEYRAVKVSFDRPYSRGVGAADFLSWDIQSVRWLESTGLDMSYTTDVDESEDPASLLHHRVYIDLGHDEYWTKAMRYGADAARDRGVSMAFLGANDSFWQARLEPDSQGVADRVLVCYKVYTHPHVPSESLNRDPEYGHDNSIVTAEWSDALLHHSEELLLGLHYGGAFSAAKFPDWVVAKDAPTAILAGTGLQGGSVIHGGLLGYEFDSYGNDSVTRAYHIMHIGESPVVTQQGAHRIAATAYYHAKSGAFIFDAGTIHWGWGLDSISPVGAYGANMVHGSAAIQHLMANILTEMLRATPKAPESY